jgi:hypothetical protein
MSRPERSIKYESSPKNVKACKSVNSMISEKKRPKPKEDSDGQKSGSPFLVILTADQARTIYQLRSVSTAEDSSACSVAGKSSLVSEIFGVSPKTIRDVWNRKTWTQVSLHIPLRCTSSSRSYVAAMSDHSASLDGGGGVPLRAGAHDAGAARCRGRHRAFPQAARPSPRLQGRPAPQAQARPSVPADRPHRACASPSRARERRRFARHAQRT